MQIDTRLSPSFRWSDGRAWELGYSGGANTVGGHNRGLVITMDHTLYRKHVSNGVLNSHTQDWIFMCIVGALIVHPF